MPAMPSISSYSPISGNGDKDGGIADETSSGIRNSYGGSGVSDLAGEGSSMLASSSSASLHSIVNSSGFGGMENSSFPSARLMTEGDDPNNNPFSSTSSLSPGTGNSQ
jgi:hypothetical protein